MKQVRILPLSAFVGHGYLQTKRPGAEQVSQIKVSCLFHNKRCAAEERNSDCIRELLDGWCCSSSLSKRVGELRAKMMERHGPMSPEVESKDGEVVLQMQNYCIFLIFQKSKLLFLH